MTTRRYYANAAPQQTLASGINATATSLTVASSFAGWPSQTPFYAVLEYGQASMEIVQVTNVTGTTATVVRAQNNTAAASHAAGATFDHAVIALDLDEANAHTTSSSGVHGVSGAVVGTTDVQTLTNKTLTAPNVTNGTLTTPTLVDALHTGDAANAALKGKATTSGGRTLSLLDSTGTEKAYMLDDGVAHVAGVNVAGVDGGNTPTGAMLMWPGNAAPTGSLLADGSAVSRTTYANLFAIYGTIYGAGDGSTTFNLPNLKGRVPVGVDAGQSEFTPIGQQGGEKTHVLTQAEMPAHTHGAGTYSLNQSTSAGASISDRVSNVNTQGTVSAIQVNGTSGSTGGGGAHNNLQPYLALNFIVKT